MKKTFVILITVCAFSQAVVASEPESQKSPLKPTEADKYTPERKVDLRRQHELNNLKTSCRKLSFGKVVEDMPTVRQQRKVKLIAEAIETDLAKAGKC